MNTIIRKGTPQDFPELLLLIKEFADFEKYPAELATNSIEQMEKEKDSFEFLIAENDGKAIGMAVYAPVYSTWNGKSLHVIDLYVKPEHRSHGVGTDLLKEVFLVARDQGYNRIKLQLDDWNTSAREFYEKVGGEIGPLFTAFDCDFDRSTIEKFLEGI